MSSRRRHTRCSLVLEFRRVLFRSWNVRYHKTMLLTQPSKRNVRIFLNKIRGILREMSSVRQDEVIDRLTPIIRGWANYHRSQMATRTFNKCDHQIWEALWRWACRRHPNKGKRWVKQRYFIVLRGRDWQMGRASCRERGCQ